MKGKMFLTLRIVFFLALFSFVFAGGCCSHIAHLDAKLWPPFLSGGFGRSPMAVNSVMEADFAPPRISMGLVPHDI